MAEQIPRQRGLRQSPSERIKNFRQASLGFSAEEALAEASRCLNCKNAPCQTACPVRVKIPEFIALLRQGKSGEAASKIMETSLLPAVCGRVCPQENLCEGACVLGKKSEPVAVGLLERFAADSARVSGSLKIPACAPASGFKVAAVGSGPSSLSAAAELARMGHSVTVFEALHGFGGVLAYGIPAFRLPREILAAEIATLRDMGVALVSDVLAGGTISVEELLKNYDAVYAGTGAGLPQMTGVPGENLPGVYSANEFLTRVNLMEAASFPETDTPVCVGENAVVLGAGNSAMDAARCALRLGAKRVTLAYRRSRAEAPARAEEIANADEEGVRFEFLASPLAFEAGADGKLSRVRFARTRLGEPDSSGRRRPEIIPGSDFFVEAETAIVAIGQRPNPLFSRFAKLSAGKRGEILTDAENRTSLTKIFAGGDAARGSATVLLAMKDGQSAALAIDKFLRSGANLF